MSDNSNTQTQPVPPVSTGPTVEELQAQLEAAKKESEGRLRDLQSERIRRQEVEAKLPPPPAPDAPSDVTQDELGKVLNPYIAPVAKMAAESAKFAAQYHQDKAIDFLAQKTGHSREAILADKDLQDKLVATARKWGFSGNVYDITVRAHEAMELENLKVKEAERVRTANANATSGMPSGAPPTPPANAREYSQADWASLPLHEYDLLAQNGSFKQNEAGKIVYTPKK